jgi:hypothetical protein
MNGCLVVADALNCQKNTVKVIDKGKADYLLGVKDNQETSRKDVDDYVQDLDLRDGHFWNAGKKQGRIECRTAFSTCDIAWLCGKEEWAGLLCTGSLDTTFLYFQSLSTG